MHIENEGKTCFHFQIICHLITFINGICFEPDSHITYHWRYLMPGGLDPATWHFTGQLSSVRPKILPILQGN